VSRQSVALELVACILDQDSGTQTDDRLACRGRLGRVLAGGAGWNRVRQLVALDLSMLDLDQGQTEKHALYCLVMDWQPIATAPFDRDLEVAVMEYHGAHALVFPCQRTLNGWLKSGTREHVNVHPTHWREWDDTVSPFFARCASS
jgi:hypothetical protein